MKAKQENIVKEREKKLAQKQAEKEKEKIRLLEAKQVEKSKQKKQVVFLFTIGENFLQASHFNYEYVIYFFIL